MSPYPALQLGLCPLGCLDLVPSVLPFLRSVSQLSLKVLHILNTNTQKKGRGSSTVSTCHYKLCALGTHMMLNNSN